MSCHVTECRVHLQVSKDGNGLRYTLLLNLHTRHININVEVARGAYKDAYTYHTYQAF